MKKATILYIIFGTLLTVFFLSLTGCKTKAVPLIQYRDRTEHDTITRTDSVYLSRYVYLNGDTVLIRDTIFRFKYLDKVRDVYVHDSIPYEVQVQVPVRVRNGYDRFTSWGFWIFVILMLIRFAWWFVKKYYLRV